MSSLGLHLRELREARGASLDDIARSTRVGRRHLEALESDSFAELPAPVFVKGFIRAYCEFLDAPPGEALSLYREATGEPVKAERSQSAAGEPSSRRVGPLLVTLVLFLALGASLFVLRIGLKRPPTLSGSAPAVEERLTSQRPVSRESPPDLPAQPAGQRLLVRAVETTWIRVQVDEGQVAEELLQAGAVREWSAAQRFVLTVGNAGGLEVDLNGRRISPLGARGVVIQKLVLPSDAPAGGS